MNIVLFAWMFFLCAFRSFEIGADTENYRRIYNSRAALSSYRYEFLFYQLMSFFREFKLGFRAFLITLSVLIYVPLFCILRKESKNLSVSILLFIVSANYYFFESFNIIRQLVATSFLLVSYSKFIRKNYLVSFLFFGVAIGFHISSLIYLPFLFLATRKVSYRFVCITILCSLVYAFAFSSIDFLTNQVKFLAEIEALNFGKYAYYSDYRLDMARNINGLLTLLLPHSFLCLYAYKRLNGNYYSTLYYWGVLFLNLISLFPTSYRMAYGLTCLELLLVPMILNRETRKTIWAYLSLLSLYFIYKVYSISVTTHSAAKLIPYEFSFD